ncbi:MAG TPA: cyclic nucleotide-binding domain-containing protein [Actinomycetota bacterium]
MSQSFPDLVLRERRPPRPPAAPEQPPRRTKRQTAAVLGAVPLFSGLPRRALERLAGETDELVFRPGQRVVEEGLLGETLFVVLSGEGKVLRKGRALAFVRPGDFFGELSALDGGPRTATVVAETPLEVLRLFRRTLFALVHDEPQLALKLMDGIVRRVREIDRRLES